MFRSLDLAHVTRTVTCLALAAAASAATLGGALCAVVS